MSTFEVFQCEISNDSRRFFSSRYCSSTPVLRLLYISSSSHVKVPCSMAFRPSGVTGWRYADLVTVLLPDGTSLDIEFSSLRTTAVPSVALALHDRCALQAFVEARCLFRSSSAFATAMPSSTSTMRRIMAPATMSKEMANMPTRESNMTVITA